MELADPIDLLETKRDLPKVPLKTYMWEDVRRSKSRGGYPWTHLNKPPFDEEPHPEHYTMEEFQRRKARSSSPKARHEGVEIEELSTNGTSDRGSVEPIVVEATTPEVEVRPICGDDSLKVIESADSEDNISQYLDKDEVVVEEERKVDDDDVVVVEAGTSSDRAKSEEPKRKRKLSVDSSYSRISLSRLGILKKLQDAKSKVKVPRFSFRKKKQKSEPALTQPEPKKKLSISDKVLSKISTTPQDTKPVYIHIPLKPPPGETDEFSYLEFEERPKQIPEKIVTTTEKQIETDSSLPSSPEPTTGDVQFIVLTPPSDDEILDNVTIPETPSVEGERFFESCRIEDLKKLAKNVVDDVEKRRLQTVAEDKENGSEAQLENEEKTETVERIEPKPSTSELKMEKPEIQKSTDSLEVPSKNEPPVPTATPTQVSEALPSQVDDEKMVVDEEDGLRQSESSAPQTDDEKLASVSGETKLRKKVSFKRKTKEDGNSKEGIYEDVQVQSKPPVVAKGMLVESTSQSMSVDEEKSYLDEKVMKTSSLEEDYNKWSKINDHEYEPVNPPPEESIVRQPPVVHVTDTDLDFTERTLESPESQRAPTPLDERHVTASPETTTDGELHTSQVDSSAIEDLPLKRSSRKKLSLAMATSSGTIGQAMRTQAGKIKDKFHGVKKQMHPKFQKFKVEKPKLQMPKIPDRMVITLPSLGQKTTKKITKEKVTVKGRQLSTESNAGDTSKRSIFDFATYPRRIFKKKPKQDVDTEETFHEPTPPRTEFATVPRATNKSSTRWAQTFSKMKNSEQQQKSNKPPKDRWGGKDTIRIPLHSEESLNSTKSEPGSNLDVEEAFQRENQEIHSVSPFSGDYKPNSRWNHGTFHEPTKVTDLDNEDNQTPPSETFDINASKEIHSSASSFEPPQHRQGVLEEINPDEFFLRQKGISQDDIDVGRILHSEIQEAFNSKDVERENGFYRRGSGGSLDKRRPIKKPKRKKTPHVSQENVDSGQESDVENNLEQFTPPVRPKRRSKRKPKDVVPYQETIPIDDEEMAQEDERNRTFREQLLEEQRMREEAEMLRENETIERILREQMARERALEEQILDDRRMNRLEGSESMMYENEQMQGIEQPEIKVSDPYYDDSLLRYKLYRHDRDLAKEDSFETPTAPPRKQKSLKSLNFSEHDSILGDPDFDDKQQERERHLEQEIEPPIRPKRSRSQSAGLSLQDDDRTSRGAESLTSDGLVPCVEEPCIRDLRDHMGYAIVDKSQIRDPPLPPPRTPPRKKRDKKFSTVPRGNHKAEAAEMPVRPLRNYSTLGPSRPPRVKNMTDEEKESLGDVDVDVDITQYIEIEEEPSKDLQSGDVIRKMRERPLPAPPRPPRKPRSVHEDSKPGDLQETEVSTQTDAVSEDFVCNDDVPVEEVEEGRLNEEQVRLTYFQVPTRFVHEETVTHGSILIDPLNGAQLIPEHEFSRKERLVPVQLEVEKEEIEKEQADIGLVKAHKLLVDDLDVNRLTVNELLANKITVSEIDGSVIQVNEISSRDGVLKVNGLELPPQVIQQIYDRLKSLQEQETSKNEEPATPKEFTQLTSTDETSSTTIQPDEDQPPPERPPRSTTTPEDLPVKPPRRGSCKPEDTPDVTVSALEPPETPQRIDSLQSPHVTTETTLVTSIPEPTDLETVADDSPSPSPPTPPRPPPPVESSVSDQRHFLDLEVDDETPPYLVPSQPPASFYALRAQQFVDGEDIPTAAPRRRRRKVVRQASSSDEEVARRRPEPSVSELTGQLVQACGTAANGALKRLITHITENVLENMDGKQDLHVMMVILLVLVAGLILLGFGEHKVVHHHHWEYFNPPGSL